MKQEKLAKILGERKMKFLSPAKLRIKQCEENEESEKMLQASMEDSGLIQPVAVVGPYSDGTYEIISGQRRVNALKKIDEKIKIPCYILGDSNTPECEIKRMRLESNLTKRAENINSLRLQYCQVLEEIYNGNSKKIRNVWVATADCSDRYCRSFRTLLKYGSPWLIDYVCKEHKWGNSIQVINASIICNKHPNNEKEQKAAVLNFLAERKVKNAKEKHLVDIVKEEDFLGEETDKEMPYEEDLSRSIFYLTRLSEAEHIKSSKSKELLSVMEKVRTKLEV